MHQTDASIIIPTRNRANWLPTCIAHLEQQTFPAARFEVIVVDDGSSDNTYSVLERYAQGSPVRIRPIRMENKGFGAARNEAVNQARGQYLVFMADDELASPRLLEHHWEAQLRSDEERCLYGEIHAHPQLPPETFTRLFLADPPPEDEYSELVSFLDAQASNLSVSRALFERTGGFQQHEDLSPLEHMLWAHQLFKSGVGSRRLNDTRSYVWQPASLEGERTRLYGVGYGLYNILKITHSSAIVDRYHLNQGSVEQALSAFLVPFYVRAQQRQHRENPVFTRTLHRRILQHDRARGFNDARLNRPRRPPSPMHNAPANPASPD